MSFDQQLGKIANSPLPTYQRQVRSNVRLVVLHDLLINAIVRLI